MTLPLSTKKGPGVHKEDIFPAVMLGIAFFPLAPLIIPSFLLVARHQRNQLIATEQGYSSTSKHSFFHHGKQSHQVSAPQLHFKLGK